MINASNYNITVRKGWFDSEQCFEARVAEYADSFEEAYALAIDTIEVTAEMLAAQGKVMPSPMIPAEFDKLLSRAAALAQSLPNQAELDYEAAVQKKLTRLPLNGTEVECMVWQRIGQNAFRKAMLDYWGNVCSVTVIAVPEVLRASHAKPWANCDSDAERLEVFNGFLLTANLDALFDRCLITNFSSA